MWGISKEVYNLEKEATEGKWGHFLRTEGKEETRLRTEIKN